MPKRKMSSATIGKAGETWAVEFYKSLFPNVEKVKRPDYGISDVDVLLGGETREMVEVKSYDEMPSKKIAGWLKKALKDMDLRPDLKFYHLFIKDNPGRGGKVTAWIVYDAYVWRDREEDHQREIAELKQKLAAYTHADAKVADEIVERARRET